MATDQSFADYVLDQASGCETPAVKKLFGEYALYSAGTVVALVCDNQVFVKPTEAGRGFIGDPVMAPPYPGAKDSFLVEDRWEDKEWFTQLIRLTARELPEPQPKKKKPLI